jgi:hypothetical protein
LIVTVDVDLSEFTASPNLSVDDTQPIGDTSRNRQQRIVHVRNCVTKKIHPASLSVPNPVGYMGKISGPLLSTYNIAP